MFEIHYSQNVTIQQLSATEFELYINNERVFNYLLVKCSSEFGFQGFMQSGHGLINGANGFWIKIIDTDLETFYRYFSLLTLQYLDQVANGEIEI